MLETAKALQSDLKRLGNEQRKDHWLVLAAKVEVHLELAQEVGLGLALEAGLEIVLEPMVKVILMVTYGVCIPVPQ